MSNTSSLELSRELFELSGWDNTPAGGKERWVELPDNSWDCLRLSDVEANGLDRQLWFNGIPSFSAGYLLRKLPREIPTDENSYFSADFSLAPSVADTWNACYRVGASFPNIGSTAETPENALCKLAIELHKASILPISGRE